MMMLNVLQELFAPGSQYTHEEQQRVDHGRQDAGSNDPCRGPIDLTSGKVVIALPGDQAVLPPRPRTEEAADVSEEPGTL